MVWMISKARHKFVFCIWLISFFKSSWREFCEPGRNKSFAIHHWITRMIKYLKQVSSSWKWILILINMNGNHWVQGVQVLSWVATQSEMLLKRSYSCSCLQHEKGFDFILQIFKLMVRRWWIPNNISEMTLIEECANMIHESKWFLHNFCWSIQFPSYFCLTCPQRATELMSAVAV